MCPILFRFLARFLAGLTRHRWVWVLGSYQNSYLKRAFYCTYASVVTETWSAVSCKAFKLRKILYWDSRPVPSIKLSEGAAREPLSKRN